MLSKAISMLLTEHIGSGKQLMKKGPINKSAHNSLRIHIHRVHQREVCIRNLLSRFSLTAGHIVHTSINCSLNADHSSICYTAKRKKIRGKWTNILTCHGKVTHIKSRGEERRNCNPSKKSYDAKFLVS